MRKIFIALIFVALIVLGLGFIDRYISVIPTILSFFGWFGGTIGSFIFAGLFQFVAGIGITAAIAIIGVKGYFKILRFGGRQARQNMGLQTVPTVATPISVGTPQTLVAPPLAEEKKQAVVA